ncbi:SAM-dependent methyltransferase [Alkalilimnicola ehrlichii]|uniref:SAM-dependent methyltransferase n=1 Tax=Alkalilimnicola ehrlichii TaxID=351052 RepID=A0A3E0X3X4_9GAMM|nr:class I SAM-dependent methyltransferase [Alkalilimnicola ehrlichii]RFA31068.1 SAM-dependent methyltransferase [Alkalilimnicola ehrlichii]RFA39027.1 SAM-dependent methyltransferase [Alkalilimnicola ehrlichii]
MDDDAQARAYAEADFEAANSSFVEHFDARFGASEPSGYILDLGCGPGDIALRLARRYPQCLVHGLDGAAAMLRFAEQALVREPELQGRVEFFQGLLPGARLPQGNYQAIVSNSLLHHLHRPQILWQAVQAYGRAGTRVMVMDLLRPASQEQARGIVDQYSGDEPAVLKRDFFNSLLAAFTLEEVRDQLAEAGIEGFDVQRISDRHMLVSGILP